MITDNIDQAISEVELHLTYVDQYGIILQRAEEDKLKIVFSEDESEFNQNVRLGGSFGAEYIAYCRDELKRHRHELEEAKGRLRLAMQRFNKGWVF